MECRKTPLHLNNHFIHLQGGLAFPSIKFTSTEYKHIKSYYVMYVLSLVMMNGVTMLIITLGAENPQVYFSLLTAQSVLIILLMIVPIIIGFFYEPWLYKIVGFTYNVSLLHSRFLMLVLFSSIVLNLVIFIWSDLLCGGVKSLASINSVYYDLATIGDVPDKEILSDLGHTNTDICLAESSSGTGMSSAFNASSHGGGSSGTPIPDMNTPSTKSIHDGIMHYKGRSDIFSTSQNLENIGWANDASVEQKDLLKKIIEKKMEYSRTYSNFFGLSSRFTLVGPEQSAIPSGDLNWSAVSVTGSAGNALFRAISNYVP